jgi:hypothetical protein
MIAKTPSTNDTMIGTKEAAEILGVKPRRMRQIQEAYNLGTMVGRDYVFSRKTILAFDRTRRRSAGRPRQS